MKATIVKIDGKTIEYLAEGKNDIEAAKLSEWVTPQFVKLGEANITISDGVVTFCKMGFDVVSTAVKPKTMTEAMSKQAPKEDIVNISGKDFMTYEGLLKKAHEKDEDFSMEILETYVSEDMKKSWCKVRLTAKGRIFDGFGSSTPENTGTMTQTYPVEMAHTRAKGRALRDYLNIGMVMKEELNN